MKSWAVRILLLLGYCVPYAFLSMNGDTAYDTMLLYGVMIICFALLCWLSVKTQNSVIIIVGNILSCLSSYLFILQYQMEKWEWYFKPFSANSLLILLSIMALLLQAAFAYRSWAKHKTRI